MLCLVHHRAQLALLAARAHLIDTEIAINPWSLSMGNVWNSSVISVPSGCAAIRAGPSLQLFPLELSLGSCFSRGGCRAGRGQALLPVETISPWLSWWSCSVLPASWCWHSLRDTLKAGEVCVCLTFLLALPRLPQPLWHFLLLWGSPGPGALPVPCAGVLHFPWCWHRSCSPHHSPRAATVIKYLHVSGISVPSLVVFIGDLLDKSNNTVCHEKHFQYLTR